MKQFSFFIGIAFLCSCRPVAQQEPHHSLSLMPEAPAWGALWQQRAAEYRALSYQAYNTARFRLDQMLEQPSARPRAIVTDVDETVLDNSPYYLHLAVQHAGYSDSSWVNWTKKVACDSVPGAPSFFQYAASKGITVFYITNRIAEDRLQTVENLKKYDFPNADTSHLMLMGAVSDKEARRQVVLKAYDIIMLLGDNLGDFSSLFDNRSMDSRHEWTEKYKADFGSKFIVLPNHMYGNWEEGYYNGKKLGSVTDSNAVLQQLSSYY
ncbi:5'-nucleotidase, lipoprotein e(P4) family [Niabella beijingensis]|uniref:5'-nucleotidase, lipoprotein e(P4) family n=1 Tax=Niabella beijingensis TaxID=2872700 RepID=UPI001CBCA61E|nr:5'-nucleotidase, lipoprotein e(P4) family [Niabella beijingensis]MBZ4188594.1 5'-nucleotidase, lipoprotein e(P4) family [Niabella beijingensis]